MGKPSMMMKMNSPSINMPTCGSVMLKPLLTQLRPFGRFGGVNPLLLEDYAFRLLDVVETSRPLADANADDATDDLGNSLQEQEYAGDGDQRLERKDRYPRRAKNAHLAEPDRHLGVIPAGIDEGQNRRQKKYDVEDEIDARLRARFPQAVHHIGAYVSVAREG